jgi:predicted aldo/keto reductase-like oxidoreductase
MLACKKKLIKQEKAGEIPLFSPSSCTGCGDCLARCPFKVDIPSEMKRAATLFEAN